MLSSTKKKRNKNHEPGARKTHVKLSGKGELRRPYHTFISTCFVYFLTYFGVATVWQRVAVSEDFSESTRHGCR
jgi:hypothetical protein